MMTNAYLNDVLAQPQALRDTLESLSEALDLNSYAHALRSGDYTRLVLTGMGSSYHALHPLWLELVANGLPAYHLETSELIHSSPALLDGRTLVVAVSQSGRSAEIVRLLQLPYAALLAVSNTPGSPLVAQASASLLTQAGEESTVSCKTYITTLAALGVLGKMLLAHDPQPWLDELSVVPEAMQRYLDGWETHVDELFGMLQGKASLMLAGRGASLAAVGTGALIIKEASHFPAEGMSSAALRHGPLNMASERLFAVVYAGTQLALNRRLVDDLLAAGAEAGLVVQEDGTRPLCLPPVSPDVLPLLEILPAQMLSLACARLTGWPPGYFRHTGKVTDIE
jgi:glucosamine--fructose-6-phosphate aminotransferase (isomerizing)